MYSAVTFRGLMTLSSAHVEALDHLAEVALVLGRVGPHRQFAVQHRFRQLHAVGHQLADGVDADVQVVLDRVEIARVDVGDLGRNVALRDAVHVFGGHVQGLDDVVQRSR
jgi:hypothetical protein